MPIEFKMIHHGSISYCGQFSVNSCFIFYWVQSLQFNLTSICASHHWYTVSTFESNSMQFDPKHFWLIFFNHIVFNQLCLHFSHGWVLLFNEFRLMVKDDILHFFLRVTNVKYMHMSNLNHSRKPFNTGNVVVQSCIYNINGLRCAHSK